MTPRSRSATTLALAFVVASVLIWLSTAQAEPAAGGPYIDVYCPAGEPCPESPSPFTLTGFERSANPTHYLYYPSGGPALDQATVDRGVLEWNDVPSSQKVTVGSALGSPSSSLCQGGGPNGVNSVSWAPIDGTTIGLACWSGVDECDILLDSSWAGALSAENVRTVLLHEVGHCQGLGHSSVPGAVMRPSFTGPQGLHPDDVAGYCAVYGCGQPPTVTPTAVPTATPLPAPRCGLRAWPGGLGGCQLLPGIARD